MYKTKYIYIFNEVVIITFFVTLITVHAYLEQSIEYFLSQITAVNVTVLMWKKREKWASSIAFKKCGNRNSAFVSEQFNSAGTFKRDKF